MILSDEASVRSACELNARIGAAASWQPDGSSVADILTAITRAAELPLEEAMTLPASAYTSPAFAAWEARNVLAAEWQCVAHTSQIPKPGDFLNLDLLGEPLIIVRAKDGTVNVLSRACPHRGMDIMPPGFGYGGHGPAESRPGEPGCGHTRLFLCPYHSWTFELDGALKACPEMNQARGFHRDEWGLKRFRCEVWNGFVFVNLDGQVPGSVAERLVEAAPHLSKWADSDLVVAVQREWDCPFNWKVLAENFMESYHHAGAHKDTLQLLMPAKDTWTEQERPHFIRCHLPYRQKVREEIQSVESAGGQYDAFPVIPGLNDEERHEWGLVLGLPNFLVATAPDSLVWYRQQPLGPDRHILTTTLLVPRAVAEHPRYSEWLEAGERGAVAFHLEDMECCTAVQRSYLASGYQQGRLSHLEMPIWLIQRYLAARARGTHPTLDRPAAPSQR